MKLTFVQLTDKSRTQFELKALPSLHTITCEEGNNKIQEQLHDEPEEGGNTDGQRNRLDSADFVK